MITVAQIKEAVASDFGISQADLESRRMKKVFARPRQAAMYLAARLTRHSKARIGDFFDRDHTTVLHAVRATSKRMANDRSLALKIEARKLLLQCDPAIHRGLGQ